VTASPAKATILVVDDERDARDIAGSLLANAGYEVLYAGNGAEAIALLRRRPVDLIVMDMMMPVMDGIAATRKLKSDPATAGIPILAITGDPGDALREDATAAGCDTYLIKPLNPVALISLVRHWVKC
jgi:two-component system sensor histidine kinase/response regulator